MADTRGTFRLKNVRQDILNNEYVPIPDVWINEPESVGYLKTYGSEFKLNFTTSTINTSSFLTSSRYGQFATSNPTYAWFIGGMPTISDSKKITYATDTGADNPSSRFSVPRGYGGVISGETISYFLGGAPYSFSTVSKLTHSSDTMVDLPGSHMSSSRYLVHSGHGGGAYGYFFRGMPGPSPDYSTTERITFANDTRTTLPSSSDMVLTNQHSPSSSYRVPYWGGSNLQCPTHCYYAGGTSGLPGGYNSNINQKLTFGSETWALNPSTLVNGRRYPTGMTANSVKGYLTAGLKAPNPTNAYDTESITFSTDTWATEPSMEFPSPSPINTYGGLSGTCLNDSLHPGPSGLPTSTKSWVAGTEYYTGNDGIWFGCGFNNHPRTAEGTAVDKMDFSSETMSQSTTVSDIIQGSQAASSNTKGYFFNGLFGAPGTPVSWIHKYDYASDTMEKLSTYTGNASWRGTTWDSSTASYMNLGSNYVHKLNYGNDTTSQTPSFGSIYASSAGVSNIAGGYGFIFGGYPAPGPGVNSTSSKLTWSTETQTYLPSASNYLSGGASSMETLGAPTAGYVAYGWMGGPYRSDLNKFHYSSETFEALTSFVNHGWGPPFGGAIQPWNPPRTRPYCNDNRGGTGNKTQGYFAGGVAGDETYYAGSWIDKITYSSDTLSTLPGLSSGWNPSDVPADLRYLRGYGATSAAQSNRIVPPVSTPTPSQFGNVNAYPSGGYSSSSTSFTNIDKIDMSTDTGTPSIGFVPTQRQNLASCSNTEKGYWAGGTTGEWNPHLTSIDKFVYSTETASLIPSQLNNPDMHNVRGGGNNTIAYVSGGPSVMRWDKMPYSTETVSGLPYLPTGRYQHNMWGNQTQGYLGGGYPHSVLSTVTKVTYSTDATSSTTNLPQGQRLSSCTSTSTNGYIWGGYLMPASSYKSLTSKWVMSNDTVSNIPGANLLRNQVKGTSAGTPTGALAIDGWGSPYPTVAGHKTQRLTYSTDTWAGVPVLPWDNKSASAAINPNQSGNAGLSPNII